MLTYTTTPEARRPDIVLAIERALKTYNAGANFSGNIDVHYDSNVPTAHTEGYRGRIVFGGTISYRIALHEIAHWVGIGTHGAWWNYRDEHGVWTGPKATAKIKQFQGPDAVIHVDNLHFWDYGMNYESELTRGADKRHVAIVRSLVADMNI
jgi:elongation factor P hydroxylase